MPGYRKRRDWGLGLFWDWSWLCPSSSSSDAPLVCEEPSFVITDPATGEESCAVFT